MAPTMEDGVVEWCSALEDVSLSLYSCVLHASKQRETYLRFKDVRAENTEVGCVLVPALGHHFYRGGD